MGIDGFNKYMQASSPGSFRGVHRGQRGGAQCRRLYVDCNDLLHQAVRRSSSADELLLALFRSLDAILAVSLPSVSVLLALDGPAPLAKLAEQRKRRQATKRKKGAGGRGRNAQSWRKQVQSELKLALSPGTELMARIQRSLLWWCASRLSAPAVDSGQSGDAENGPRPKRCAALDNPASELGVLEM